MSSVDCPASRGECCYYVLISRRLRRMIIVKKKRELGLINIANSKAVRYTQKQTTAFKKARRNGKFTAVSAFVYSVCNKTILNIIYFTGSDLKSTLTVSN